MIAMDKDLFLLNGKVALVTGACGLLGREHCQALARAGANVVAGDQDNAACRELAAHLPAESAGVSLDVTDPASIGAALGAVLKQFGRVDILVNNAALNDKVESPLCSAAWVRFEDYSLQAWQKQVDVNLTGVFLCSQIIGTRMVRQGGGSIINIASTYGLVAPDPSLYRTPDGEQLFFKSPAYSATKGAVISFTRYLAAYWGKAGVRVNTLSPGGVQNGQADWFVQAYALRTPVGRMAQPDDYRGALIFLASDASAYMTGANLVVDGGWTAW